MKRRTNVLVHQNVLSKQKLAEEEAGKRRHRYQPDVTIDADI